MPLGFGRCHHSLGRLYGCGMTLLLSKYEFLDCVNVQASGANCGIEAGERRIIVLLAEFVAHVVREFQLPVLEAAFQKFLAVYGAGLFLNRKGLLDLGAGLGSYHPVDPVRRRVLVFGGENFDDISRGELLLNGNSLSVNLCANAVGAYVGVYSKCKVQYRGAGAQYAQFSGWREHENLL